MFWVLQGILFHLRVVMTCMCNRTMLVTMIMPWPQSACKGPTGANTNSNHECRQQKTARNSAAPAIPTHNYLHLHLHLQQTLAVEAATLHIIALFSPSLSPFLAGLPHWCLWRTAGVAPPPPLPLTLPCSFACCTIQAFGLCSA